MSTSIQTGAVTMVTLAPMIASVLAAEGTEPAVDARGLSAPTQRLLLYTILMAGTDENERCLGGKFG